VTVTAGSSVFNQDRLDIIVALQKHRYCLFNLAYFLPDIGSVFIFFIASVPDGSQRIII